MQPVLVQCDDSLLLVGVECEDLESRITCTHQVGLRHDVQEVIDFGAVRGIARALVESDAAVYLLRKLGAKFAPEKLPCFCHDYAGPQGRWEAPEIVERLVPASGISRDFGRLSHLLKCESVSYGVGVVPIFRHGSLNPVCSRWWQLCQQVESMIHECLQIQQFMRSPDADENSGSVVPIGAAPWRYGSGRRAGRPQ